MDDKTVLFWQLGEYMTLDKKFYSLLLITGRIVTLDRSFYNLLLATGRIHDIGQKVLQSSSGNWANTWQWAERFTVFFSNMKQSQPHLLPHFFLIAFLERAFIRNIIIPYINYNVITGINNNNNNNNNNSAVFNNNLLKSPRCYTALQIYHGQRKHLFEIYRQFGLASSKRLASPGLDYGVQDTTQLRGQTEKLNLTAHTPCIILTIN